MNGLRFLQHFIKLFLILGLVVVMSSLYSSSLAVAEKRTSEATIEFVPVSQEMTPMNPEKPSEALAPDQKQVKDTFATEQAELRLDYVAMPRILHNKKYEADDETNQQDKKRFLQIANLSSMNSIWMVTANMADVRHAKTKELIHGAELTLENSQLSSLSHTGSPKANTSITLRADGEAVPIVVATSGNGRGIWLQSWDEDTSKASYHLASHTSPKKQEDGYETDITWTLVTAPFE